MGKNLCLIHFCWSRRQYVTCVQATAAGWVQVKQQCRSLSIIAIVVYTPRASGKTRLRAMCRVSITGIGPRLSERQSSPNKIRAAQVTTAQFIVYTTCRPISLLSSRSRHRPSSTCGLLSDGIGGNVEKGHNCSWSVHWWSRWACNWLWMAQVRSPNWPILTKPDLQALVLALGLLRTKSKSE